MSHPHVSVCLSLLACSQWMVKSRVISELQEACWDMVSAMAGDIILMLDSDNDGVRTHAIKFVEAFIVTLSPRMADSEVPRRHEHDVSLDRVPRDHPYIQYSECPQGLVPLASHRTDPSSSSSPLVSWFSMSGDKTVRNNGRVPGHEAQSPVSPLTSHSLCEPGQVTSL